MAFRMSCGTTWAVHIRGQAGTCSGSVQSGSRHLLSSPGFSLLDLFSQLCLLRDFGIIWERPSKVPFAALSQSLQLKLTVLLQGLLGVPLQQPVTFLVSFKPIQVFFWCVPLPDGHRPFVLS